MRIVTAVSAFMLVAAAGRGLDAQVLVAPTALFLSADAPFGAVLVANRSHESQEVTIDFRFGYPASDSQGDLYMAYGDSLKAFSMEPWVRAFPRRFALGPGQEQLVRVVARPPAGLADGTYWTRLVTTSSGRGTTMSVASGGASAQVVLRVEQVTAVLFRRGSLNTEVDIGEPRVVSDSAGTRLRIPLARRGNSPFLGRIGVRILDAQGVPAAEAQEYIALYVDLTKRFNFPRLAPGNYTVEITVASKRPDIPRENLIQILDVARRFSLRIP